MSTNSTDQLDPEDMFHDTRMSFGDHIEDLRSHLLRALKGFAIGMVVSLFFLGQYVMRTIVEPLEIQLEAFETRVFEAEMKKVLEEQKNFPVPAIYTPIDFNKEDLEIAFGLK